MTTLQRVRVRVRGQVQGVGFRPVRPPPGRRGMGLAGHVLNDAAGRADRGRGTAAGDLERLLAAAARRGAAAGPHRAGRARSPSRPPAGDGVRRSAPAARAGAADGARHCRRGHLRRLPARAARPGRPPLPLPVHQLHQLRPAATRSCAASPTTGRTRRWRASPCARRARREYDDPADRRFHAQPNACPACGPQVRLVGRTARRSAATPSRGAARRWPSGRIVAVKGLGGFHLACRRRATRPPSRGLRARKHREDKPFALMVADVATARGARRARTGGAARCSTAGAARSCSPPRRAGARGRGGGRARRTRELGVMLPYTPLHHLLLGDAARRCARW